MLFEDYPAITNKLMDSKNQYYGQPSCTLMLKTFLLVGNSTGIIRFFDMKNKKEMKPLMDQQAIGAHKVTSMDTPKPQNPTEIKYYNYYFFIHSKIQLFPSSIHVCVPSSFLVSRHRVLRLFVCRGHSSSGSSVHLATGMR